jgi:hypothetical protein
MAERGEKKSQASWKLQASSDTILILSSGVSDFTILHLSQC